MHREEHGKGVDMTATHNAAYVKGRNRQDDGQLNAVCASFAESKFLSLSAEDSYKTINTAAAYGGKSAPIRLVYLR